MRSCGPHPELVGAAYWLPTEPFEHGWASPVGCNQLVCRRCRERVASQLLPDGRYRRYQCRCQTRDEAWSHRLEADPDDRSGGPLGWRCAGHPELSLPARLDGVALDEAGYWAAVARVGLTAPLPFAPPRVELGAVWVTRLYRLLASETARARLGTALGELLGDGDAALVGGALDFFINEPSAAGAVQLATAVAARPAWLGATAHPRRPGSTLLAVATLALAGQRVSSGTSSRTSS
jgi:hypothetical protein